MWVITYKYAHGFWCYGTKPGKVGEVFPTRKLAEERLKTCQRRKAWQVTRLPEEMVP